MFAFALLLALAACFVLHRFILYPLFTYWRDAKGLRRYHNYSPWSAISDWPYCRLSARGFRSRDLTELHKKHSIIRLGPNALSFGSVDAIRGIYGHGTGCVKDVKYSITASAHPNMFDVVEKKKHAEKRKRLSAAFAISHLEEWEFKVARTTERLLTALDKFCTDSNDQHNDFSLDYNHWVNLFTIEAINYLALSSDLGLLEQGNDNVTAEKLDGTRYQAKYRESQNAAAYAVSHFVWDYENYKTLSFLSKLWPNWRKTWNVANRFGDIVYHQANTRLQRYKQGEKLDDFFSNLMDDKKGLPYGLEWGEIVGDVHAIIDAGSETTAIALTQIMEFLFKNPQHLHTLRAELDNALDPDEIVAPFDKVKDLPFLKACLDEGMRFIPPTSAGLPRRTPPEGARVMGEWIAGNVGVSVPIYTAHRDPAVFHNPDEFNPQRWMDPSERRRMESCFIPFSTGGRGCIGRNISYLEQQIVLASFVHRYEFALPSTTWELERFEAFNLLVGKMPMKIWRREMPLVD